MAIDENLAYLYGRVSSGKQAAADLSLPDQFAQMEAWCEGEGIHKTRQFTDAKTGRTASRESFTEMLDQAFNVEPHPSVVMVYSYSRVFRNAVEFELMYQKLAKAGIQFKSLTQPENEDPAIARMIRGIFSLFDEYQSEETAKHVSRTMCQNARDGFWNGSTPPYGYQTVAAGMHGVRAKKKLAIQPVEAEVVKLIYSLYIEGRPEEGLASMGVKAICEWLNGNGYRNQHGNLFGGGQVHGILTKKTYIGEHEYNRKDSRTGKRRPQSEVVTMKCPAIVSEVLFERARRQAKAANPKKGRPAAVAGPVLLAELAKCGQCGSAMTATTGTSSTGKIYEYYKCVGKVRIGNAKCTGVSISRSKLNEAVMSTVARQVLDPERIRILLGGIFAKHKEEASQVSGRTSRLADEVAEAEVALKRIYSGVTSGILDPTESTLKCEIDDLRAKRDSAKAALENMKEHKAVAESLNENQISRFASQLSDKLENGTVAFRKSYLKILVGKIVVHKDRVELMGRADRLVEALAKSVEDESDDVRANVPNWCTREDSNL